MPRPGNWHAAHEETLSFGDRLADKIAAGMGSWRFIIWQSAFVAVWIAANTVHGWENYFVLQHWDDYPFVMLNLLFSTQAAYSAPIIMMSQNRQAARDRAQADADHATNVAAEKEIRDLLTVAKAHHKLLSDIHANTKKDTE